MSETTNLDILFIAGGVAGQRLGANKWFDPSITGPEIASTARGHIMDPVVPLQRSFNDLPHMDAARSEGRLTVSTKIPYDRPFDVAYIASPTGLHIHSLEEVLALPEQPRRIILEKPIVSGRDEEKRLNYLLRSGGVDPARLYVHEPYLVSTGLQRMREIMDKQQEAGNPPVDIRVWSAKDRTADVRRGRTGNEPALGAFGVEFPHTHAAASKLAGVELDVGHLSGKNIYYQEVDGDPVSEATYTEFHHNDTVIRVAQGLGPFAMTSDGIIKPSSNPGVVRSAQVEFKYGQRIRLNLTPSVDSKARTKNHPYAHTVLEYVPNGAIPTHTEYIPDYPIQTIIRNVLQQLNGNSAPFLPGIGPKESLERCIAIRHIREVAQVITGFAVGR